MTSLLALPAMVGREMVALVECLHPGVLSGAAIFVASRALGSPAVGSLRMGGAAVARAGARMGGQAVPRVGAVRSAMTGVPLAGVTAEADVAVTAGQIGARTEVQIVARAVGQIGRAGPAGRC